MTFIPHSMQLLEERFLLAPTTAVTFSSLFKRNPDNRMLRLYMSVVNPTVSASDYLIAFDGDFTFTNYNSNAMSAANGVTNFARVNTPRVIDAVPASPSGIFYGYTDIIYNENFTLCRWISMNVRGDAFPIGFINYAGTWDAFISPLDTIDIISTIANAIGTGSKFKLFRVSNI